MMSQLSPQAMRAILHGSDYETEEAYDKAREVLEAAEKSRAFDAEAISASSDVEKQANDLVQKIKIYDQNNTYGLHTDDKGNTTRNRGPGHHFLGNIDLINESWLMKVARQMPKGAHLHIHFNSCLPASFLIQQARDIEAMYIRSSVPLTTQANMALSRISFMVLTPYDATHPKDDDGIEKHVPLGNVFHKNYVSSAWMPYKQFQEEFDLVDEHGRVLSKTAGAEVWLEGKLLISEEEAHNIRQTTKGIWERFSQSTQMMKGLFAYESAFRNYTRALIEDFVKDNIQYAEIRPNFMATNNLKTDDGRDSINNEGIMNIIGEEVDATTRKLQKEGIYFGGLKVIYCTPRSFSRDDIRVALNECIDLKLKFPDLLCGFDLAGPEEMGNELYHFVPEFLEFRQKCKAHNVDIPFLFHCGETLDVGSKVDGNLFDAILLNAKRIGHGYALASHPLLLELFKAKNIAIEACPISNEVLGLTPFMAGHNLSILLANNVACTVNSDNATYYKSSLSHDFYQVMIGSESMSLLGWKQLAKWSLEHSCMNNEERQNVGSEWEIRWREFCQWILVEYGPILKDYDKGHGPWDGHKPGDRQALPV